MAQGFYYSIASGSTGNCGLYVAGETTVLIDVGVSLRRVTTALTAVGLSLDAIDAVLLTHDHIDHVKGLPMLLKKADMPVFAPRGTVRALAEKQQTPDGRLTVFDGGDDFALGGLAVQSFRTPHDAAESVGFVLAGAGRRFGFATDLGFVPDEAKGYLRGCDTVVLESNHDPLMLDAGPYPYPLKVRVRGPYGHLSNPDCASVAADLVQNGTKNLILAHLSEKNNMPALALQQTQQAIRSQGNCRVVVAPRDRMEQPLLLEEDGLCSRFG